MTTKEQAQSILDDLSGIPELRLRPMMGEYVLYYRDKVVGGIYDGALLLKSIEGADALLGHPFRRVPYENAKEMLVVEKTQDTALLHRAFEAVWEKVEFPRKRRKK